MDGKPLDVLRLSIEDALEHARLQEEAAERDLFGPQGRAESL